MGGEAAVKAAQEAGWTELKAIAISGVQGDSTATARLTATRRASKLPAALSWLTKPSTQTL